MRFTITKSAQRLRVDASRTRTRIWAWVGHARGCKGPAHVPSPWSELAWNLTGAKPDCRELGAPREEEPKKSVKYSFRSPACRRADPQQRRERPVEQSFFQDVFASALPREGERPAVRDQGGDPGGLSVKEGRDPTLSLTFRTRRLAVHRAALGSGHSLLMCQR
jgi:hypothetical protein